MEAFITLTLRPPGEEIEMGALSYRNVCSPKGPPRLGTRTFFTCFKLHEATCTFDVVRVYRCTLPTHTATDPCTLTRTRRSLPTAPPSLHSYRRRLCEGHRNSTLAPNSHKRTTCNLICGEQAESAWGEAAAWAAGEGGGEELGGASCGGGGAAALATHELRHRERASGRLSLDDQLAKL